MLAGLEGFGEAPSHVMRLSSVFILFQTLVEKCNSTTDKVKAKLSMYLTKYHAMKLYPVLNKHQSH